jgi:hypothetical protein
MARVLYFDAFSGVSGDMTVGALLALGAPLDRLRGELAKLAVGGYRVEQSVRRVNGIQAVKFDVVLDSESPRDHPHERGDEPHHGHSHDRQGAGGGDHGHVRFAEIRDLLQGSGLEPAVRDRAIAIFTKLAIAEGTVHGVPPDDVSFHEVGAIDSIVDIAATAICIQSLAIDEVYVSPLPLGSGFVDCRHGTMPVPAPATVQLLQGFPVRYCDGAGELVTPTGAAIIAALARPGAPAELRVERVGYGAGTRVLDDRPNLLRLVLGETEPEGGAARLVVIEANIDDSNPEIYEHVCELLFAAGARDVWLQPVVMKKGRPAVVLSILGDAGLKDVLAGIVLRETSSIGVRHYAVDRVESPRSEHLVDTEFGPIPVKVARAPDGTLNVAPEYDACRRIARERSVALKQVYAAAIAAARHLSLPTK